MQLFTKEIDKKLFAQYRHGGDLKKQVVVAKIFNPYGGGTWYLLNSDPKDPDYLWCIVDLFEVEIGSVSRKDLETIQVPPFRLPLERDLYWKPKNAKEVYDGLIQGKTYAKGGKIKAQEPKIKVREIDGEHVKTFQSVANPDEYYYVTKDEGEINGYIIMIGSDDGYAPIEAHDDWFGNRQDAEEIAEELAAGTYEDPWSDTYAHGGETKEWILSGPRHYAKGGETKKWIKGAIEHPGRLRAKAKRKGLIHDDEKLSESDLHKLESEGGKTAKEAHLAETLHGFHKKAEGGPVTSAIPLENLEKIAEYLSGRVWSKGELVRIYVTGGNNYHYNGKWWYEIYPDGGWQSKCWLDGGYYNKNREDYVHKHLRMMDDEMETAISETENQ